MGLTRLVFDIHRSRSMIDDSRLLFSLFFFFFESLYLEGCDESQSSFKMLLSLRSTNFMDEPGVPCIMTPKEPWHSWRPAFDWQIQCGRALRIFFVSYSVIEPMTNMVLLRTSLSGLGGGCGFRFGGDVGGKEEEVIV
jgi:hypothetical protein